MSSLKVLAFGSNGSGQLGIGHNEDVSTPQSATLATVCQTSTAIQIAAGGNHSVFLLDGKLASAGNNEDGRCFAVASKQTNVLMQSSLFGGRAVKHIAATWSATIAVCDEGMVWTCGTGLSGELGLGESITVCAEPLQIPDFPPSNTSIVKLSACMGHVVAVLSNGEAWGWGKGRKAQLGVPMETVSRPRRIEGIPFFVVNAVCGKDFTCVFGDPADGQLLMLGPTGTDRFGIRKSCPESVCGWKQVAATWGSVLVLSDSGRLTGWGRNDHGQLPPPDLPLLKSFTCGSEHCLGLTKPGKVLAWGWGEHGNCGLPTDTHGDVKGRWNAFETSTPVAAVFAGCATSFVVTEAP